MSLPPFNRRSFLKTAAVTAILPASLSSRLRAAETPANDRITLGFIGMGKQAGGLMGGFLNAPGTQVVAVCDVDTTRRNAAKQKAEEYYSKKNATDFKGCTAYNDFRELLARDDIDAVVIATPDHWHAPLVIAAAKAGKEIYCEKPLCETIHESRAMVNAIRQQQRIFQIGSMQRSSPEFRWACEIVRAGKIGKIQRVEAGFGGPGKTCNLPAEELEAGLDWDMWLGPALQRPYNSVLSPRGVHTHFPAWRDYWEYGGGMVTDWGAHHLDITQWGLGMDDSGPVEVIPAENPLKAQSGSKLVYANGVEVTHIPENGVTFFGTDGEVFVNRGKFKLTLNGKVLADSTAKPEDASQKPLGAGALAEKSAKELLGSQTPILYESKDHKGDFLNAIRTRKDPICPIEVGAHSVIACHLLNFAYRYGQRLKWDPAQEKFLDGTGNPQWLTREYRDAWKVV